MSSHSDTSSDLPCLRFPCDGFEALTSSLGLALFHYDRATGAVRGASEGFSAILGVEVESLTGDPAAFVGLAHPDDRESLRVTLTARAGSSVFRIAHPAGEERWIHLRTVPPSLAGDTGVLEDVTDRVFADRALRANARREAVLAHIGHLAVESPDIETLVEAVPRLIDEALGEGVGALVRADGTVVPPASSHALAPEDQRFLDAAARLLGSALRRRLAEAALAERERRFTALVEHAQDFVTIVDASGTIVYESPAADRLLGYGPSGRVGTQAATYVHPADAERMRGVIASLRSQPGAVARVEIRARHADGGWLTGESVLTNLLHDPAVRGIVVNGRDVTERRAAESALREEHAILVAVTEATPDAVYVKDADGNILFMNTPGAAMLGARPSELIGTTIACRVPPDEAEAIRRQEAEIMASGETRTHEHPLTVGGQTLVKLTTKGVLRGSLGAPNRLFGISRDITKKRQLEEELRQAAKMEAVGQLAGGVAHDINNMLTAIQGFNSFLLDGLAPGDPLRGDAAEIGHAAERAAAMTQQLLAFSRRQVLQPVVLDLRDVVSGFVPLLQRLVGPRVQIVTSAPDTLGSVRADRVQLEQVLMNLCANARDAMPEGGRIAIEVGETPDRASVTLSVADTGTGMDEATLQRMFEPFFTTKPKGKGTGLGLATVHGVVHQSGGRITCESMVGRGTTFRISLPRLADATPAVSAAPRDVALAGHGETILVVDDEDSVRAFVARALRREGYTVVAASSGEAALEALDHHGGPIRVLVTDYVMPGMTGCQLAKQVRARLPGLPVVLMTGHADDLVEHQGKMDARSALLHKPFGPAELARRVAELLAAEPVRYEHEG